MLYGFRIIDAKNLNTYAYTYNNKLRFKEKSKNEEVKYDYLNGPDLGKDEIMALLPRTF